MRPAPSHMPALARAAALALALALPGAPLAAEPGLGTLGSAYETAVVTEGLDHPWGLAFLPNGDALVTERSGALRLVRDGALEPEPVAGVPEVYAARQGGLLDIALDPGFAENGLVYLSYAERARGGAGTAVARGRFTGDALQDVEVIFRAAPKTPGAAHYGSRLAFGRDGMLYVTVGDRYGYMREAQNPANHLGAILRIAPDGAVPADNPFADQPGAAPEIWSIGHRNPQGLAVRPADGSLWAHEHGPRGGDEVNVIAAGRNYGWPAITYGIDYSGRTISELTEAPGMEQPVIWWDPSIAPSGMAFYEGAAFPAWQGDLFLGALAGAHLRRLELEGDRVVAEEELLHELNARIRDVRQGPDGHLYVLTDAPAPRGALIRIDPAG